MKFSISFQSGIILGTAAMSSLRISAVTGEMQRQLSSEENASHGGIAQFGVNSTVLEELCDAEMAEELPSAQLRGAYFNLAWLANMSYGLRLMSPLVDDGCQVLDKLVGLAMLVAATVVFLYYTVWTLLMPFVDDDHPLQNFFLPRVWAIRIPVILILLGSAVVGSFLGMVMIRSNRKKAAKAKAAAASKKKA
ncbi:hypothetical protein NLG97_g9283 [Lecanicillium saksenae]|uniref:Uncharacterized protein n=1 Tax=Lecanicillium saksenae TaxID=468837 RepID=A0ACC1QGH2_9HYPO|nr:hypothetical protein NLG97_g9283 [Lecanicillium saksenae]